MYVAGMCIYCVCRTAGVNGNAIEGKPIGCVFVCVSVLLLRCVVARGKRVPFWQHMPMKFSECTPFFHSGTLMYCSEGSHSGTLMYCSEGSHSGTLMYCSEGSHSGTLMYCSEGSHSGTLTHTHTHTLTGILHTLTHTLSTLLEAVPACSTPVLCVHVASY